MKSCPYYGPGLLAESLYRLPQIDLNTTVAFLKPSTLWHRDEGLGSKVQESSVERLRFRGWGLGSPGVP